MDKRYEPLKEYGRVNKKPKLEIVVNKGRSNQKTAPGPSRDVKLRSPPKSSPDDFWDDDDDEVILLASQVVEKEIPRGQTIQASMDFTFSEFAPNAKVTSTQKLFAPDVELFSELLDDDWGMDAVPEEPVFKVPIMAPLKRPHQACEPSTIEKNSNDRPFSDLIKSATPAFSQVFTNGSERQSNSASISLTQPAPSSKPSNREKAHECQIQFLQKRADILKKENTKIAKELDEFKNKMESKDGEVSLLRDEIRHLKQQIQNALREKVQKTDIAKSEWQEKINELSKQVEAQQTVLEFKTMEISKLKMNHGDDSMRFEHSMRGNESMLHQSNIKITSPNRRQMTQLQGSVRRLRIPVTCSIPIEIFDHSTEKGNSKFRKDVFQREMERLQFQMSRLQYVTQLKADQRTELTKSVIDSAKNVVAEFWTYVHSLEYNKHCQSLPYHEYDITKDRSASNKRCSLFQAEELFPSEKTINLRRYIAGLTIVCQMVPEVSELLFTVHHNEYLLVQIIVDALNKLGFSHEICQHFGVVESFALLLSTLWANHIDNEKYQEHLVGFLKTLIFCRPNAWTNKYITRCFLKLSGPAREQLCCNSSPHTFSVSQSIYKFTADSCILQVYAGLLEITFPVHQELSGAQFKLLAEICYNHLSFFTDCFPDPPPFVADILPYDDDLDDDGMCSQRPGVNITCQCYVMMCSSVVKLLYQVMRQWQRTGRQQELKLIESLSKVGVRLVHTIYIRYYMTKLFDHKGYLTRHYLYFVCKYWLESMDLLGFTEIHRESLDQLASSHIIEMSKSPKEEPNTSKVDRDLARWYTHSGETKSEANGSTTINCELNDFATLQILEKTCTADTFLKRY